MTEPMTPRGRILADIARDQQPVTREEILARMAEPHGATVASVLEGRICKALLAAMTELEQVKGERDHARQLFMNACEPLAASPDIQDIVTAVEEWVNRRGGEETADQIAIMAVQAYQRATTTAAETALAAMTAREGVLRAFIDDFATAKIDALRYQPSYGESPEDEPDPVVDATEVWAWQSDAKDILTLKETPDA